MIPANPLFSIETMSLLLSFTAGTILLMWLGELISERGLGNGISFIIFAGIVGSIPQQIGPIISGPDAFARLIPFVIVAIVVVAAVVFINEGQRRIPVQYASRVRGRRMYQGQTQYLPLKVTMAGVIPIIFAVSILLFPAQIATYFTTSEIDWVRDVATFISTNLNGQNNIPLYGTLYFLLVVFFTYFYTAFQFRPDQTADYLRKNGGFIPGIRPGQADRGVPRPRHEPDHARRRALPRHHRRAALHRVGVHPRHEQPAARRHEHPDHGERGGRDDEAARGADDDASLRGLHQVTDEPGGADRLILLLVGAVGAGKGTQAGDPVPRARARAPRIRQPVPCRARRRDAARRGGARVHGGAASSSPTS